MLILLSGRLPYNYVLFYFSPIRVTTSYCLRSTTRSTTSRRMPATSASQLAGWTIPWSTFNSGREWRRSLRSRRDIAPVRMTCPGQTSRNNAAWNTLPRALHHPLAPRACPSCCNTGFVSIDSKYLIVKYIYNICRVLTHSARHSLACSRVFNKGLCAIFAFAIPRHFDEFWLTLTLYRET